jgi:RNA polymerase sigma factor (sigma-70 family)
MVHESDQEQLLRRAAAGDQDAVAAVVRDLYPTVQRMVHKQLERDFRRQHDWMIPLFSTGDIVQDVFLGVVRDLERFEPRTEQSLHGWLATLVKHRILDTVRHHEALRRDRRRDVVVTNEAGDPVSFAGNEPTPSRCAELGEVLGSWEQVLEDLSERERRLLELRLTDNRPWLEIAEQLAFPSHEAARFAFRYLKAKLLVRLRKLGVQPGTVSAGEDL